MISQEGTLYLNGERLGRIDPLGDIEPVTEGSGSCATLLNGSSETFTATLTGESAMNLWRILFSRGQRNSQILKRDGYLSPSNGEMEGKDDQESA